MHVEVKAAEPYEGKRLTIEEAEALDERQRSGQALTDEEKAALQDYNRRLCFAARFYREFYGWRRKQIRMAQEAAEKVRMCAK